MKIFTTLVGITFMSVICKAEVFDVYDKISTDSYLNTEQLIQKYGYPSEAHTVETADGYFVTMHRIPHGKQVNRGEPGTPKGRKPPVFLQHGLLGSSSNFFIIAPKVSLAFMLADLGYDVWLGNVRGNTFSRGHATLFPSQKEFWNFTWHESSVYDLPRQIDFVCNYTNQEKLVFVGFSMGTTMYFAMMSALPQYNEKIELSLLMAPIVYAKHIKSTLLRLLTTFTYEAKILVDLIDKGEFLPSSKLLRLAGKILCEKNNIEKSLCMNAIFLIVGKDPAEFDKSRIAVLINHYPAGYSIKGLAHYSQLIRSGKFQQYNYGKKGNMLQYGSPTPPEYNLTLTTTPLYLYQGKNDYLSTLQDVDNLVGKLPTLKKRFIIDYPRFTHLDFLASDHVKTEVYDVLIDDMTSYLNGRDDIESNSIN